MKLRCIHCSKANGRIIDISLIDELAYQKTYLCNTCHKQWSVSFPLKTETNKYVLLYKPLASGGYYTPLHRWVWEQVHGIKLDDSQVVHHLNGIKSDNRPANLFAIPERQHAGHFNRNKKRTPPTEPGKLL